ncbi:hypothetical protein BDP27DRAFT_1431346 [Rhodocollybia butyracea]|uniref:Uncharacterized protein n=1 Tax=Rhodocollybia butyracea TaxID=206335 RepID=A0A9P5PC15_9AGAR|nr:hypothetical protein BDP27DRAFT_1431346 [Rhodocollybia butyracea]
MTPLYLSQKLLKYSTDIQKNVICNSVTQDLVNISLNIHTWIPFRLLKDLKLPNAYTYLQMPILPPNTYPYFQTPIPTSEHLPLNAHRWTPIPTSE